jgi:hypothetical protein
LLAHGRHWRGRRLGADHPVRRRQWHRVLHRARKRFSLGARLGLALGLRLALGLGLLLALLGLQTKPLT